MIEPRRRGDRHQVTVAGLGQEAEFAIAGLGGSKNDTGNGTIRLAQAGGKRHADEIRLAPASQPLKRRIDLHDAALGINDDEHIGDGRDDARYEGLRLFQLGILGLEIRLVAQKIGIDLVHLGDDIDPHRLAFAVEFGEFGRMHLRHQSSGARAIGRLTPHPSGPVSSHTAPSWREARRATIRDLPKRG